MGGILRLLRGLDHAPIWTASGRAALEALIMGGLVAIAPEIALPFATVIIRFLEGMIDQIDPVKKRIPKALATVEPTE